jgi:hypothetical protein
MERKEETMQRRTTVEMKVGKESENALRMKIVEIRVEKEGVEAAWAKTEASAAERTEQTMQARPNAKRQGPEGEGGPPGECQRHQN